MNPHDNIDLFILGQLEGQEKATFEQLMETDSSFASEVKKRQLIAEGLESLGNQQMKARIRDIRKEMLAEKKIPTLDQSKQKTKIIRLLLVAASIAFLIISWQFLNSSEFIPPKQLFTEYYQPYNASFGTRNNNQTNDLSEAEALYKSQSFNAAIPLFEKIQKNQPNNSNIKLALGNAYLQNNNLSKAKQQFQNIIDKKDALYVDQATWYLALSHLYQEEVSQTKKLLSRLLKNKDADFHEEAKALLQKLE